MHSRLRVGHVLAGLSLSACGPIAGGSGGAALSNCPTGAMTYEDATVRLVRTVGGEDTGEGPVFGHIQGVAVSEKGDLVVLDFFANAVVTVDPDGVVSGTRGSAGSGPGEFEAPFKLGLDSDGVIHVMDPSLSRITRFHPGPAVTTQQLPPAPEGRYPQVEFDRDGRLHKLSFEPFAEAVLAHMEQGVGRVVRGANVLQRWDQEGETWLDLKEMPGQEIYLLSETAYTEPPFPATPVWAAASDGEYWYGDGATPTITRYSSERDARCVVTLDIEPVPVSEAERQAFYDVTDVDLPPDVRSGWRRTRELLPVPDHKPAMLSARSSSEGDIWIEVRTADGVVGSVWYGVDLSERVVRRVTLPADFAPMSIDAENLYGPRTNPPGRPQVAVYEFQIAAGGGG